MNVASPAGAGRPEVTASGHQRTGTWRDHRDSGARSLYIVSTCDWRARLIPPADVSSPEPQPGRTHRGKGHHPGKPKKHHGHGKGHKKHAKKKHRKQHKKPKKHKKHKKPKKAKKPKGGKARR